MPKKACLRANGFIPSLENNIDVYIFTGPILKQIIMPDYDLASVIRRISESGKKYMLLSTSASEMSDLDVAAAAAILNQYKPLLFATRDRETYNKFKPVVPFCRDGICCAFLIPYIDGVAAVKHRRPYFISSFYRSAEPYFAIKEPEGRVTVDSLEVRNRRNIMGLKLRISRHFEWMRKDYLSSLNGVDIIRVHQGFNPFMRWFNYGRPNSFVSYNPRCYLSVYKGCEFVVTDRVHACAAALAYGHPARLLYENDRMGIFDRMGFVRGENGTIMPIAHSKYCDEVESFAQCLSDVLGMPAEKISLPLCACY